MVLAGRALVVDDSRAIREAMTSMLGREGWIVDVAEDGARALQMTRQLRYDLVVTDLEMPELGGFELIARLRKDERFKTTPIVIITSRANPEHRRRAQRPRRARARRQADHAPQAARSARGALIAYRRLPLPAGLLAACRCYRRRRRASPLPRMPRCETPSRSLPPRPCAARASRRGAALG